MRRLRTAAVCTGLALLLAAGCSGGEQQHSTQARIRVDRPVALADEPVRIRVTGLHAGEEVTITSRATDVEGMRWTGRAAFTADDGGTVDLARARPRSGTYRKADGMGLFWSMKPEKGPADEAWFVATSPERQPAYQVRLAVHADGERIAARTLTRTWMREGITHRPLTVAADGVHGALYLPPEGSPRRLPVLNFGGSDGGAGDKHAAALLASRGHPALDQCYFDCPGRPDALQRIDLEYFATAARLLDRRYGTGSQRPAVIGTSRGSEPAQLLAHHYPDLVGDVVVYAPSRNTNPGLPEGDVAWTKGGKPVEHSPIPLDRARGTVLAIGGADDGLWPAASAAQEIGEQHGASDDRHRALVYDRAGHHVGMYPYTAGGRFLKHPQTGQLISMGGTRAANAQARADSWPQVLRLLQG